MHTVTAKNYFGATACQNLTVKQMREIAQHSVEGRD
jgi:hypothetical protein